MQLGFLDRHGEDDELLGAIRVLECEEINSRLFSGPFSTHELHIRVQRGLFFTRRLPARMPRHQGLTQLDPVSKKPNGGQFLESKD